MTSFKKKSGFSKLNKWLFTSPDDDDIVFFEQVYLRERVGDVKAYTVLTVKGISASREETSYTLVDENGNVCCVERYKFCKYRGQDLFKQKIYDGVVFSITMVLLIFALVFYI